MILTYDDWLKSQIKYTDCKCGVAGCNEKGLYEGGDARCWFPICEKHTDMKQRYLHYLNKYSPIKLTEHDVELAYSQCLNAIEHVEKRIKELTNGDN